MLKLNSNAWWALWYLFKWKAQILVPLFGGLGLISVFFGAPLIAPFEYTFIALAFAGGAALAVWLIGMAGDVFFLVLKFILQGIIIAGVKTVRTVGRLYRQPRPLRLE